MRKMKNWIKKRGYLITALFVSAIIISFFALQGILYADGWIGSGTGYSEYNSVWNDTGGDPITDEEGTDEGSWNLGEEPGWEDTYGNWKSSWGTGPIDDPDNPYYGDYEGSDWSTSSWWWTDTDCVPADAYTTNWSWGPDEFSYMYPDETTGPETRSGLQWGNWSEEFIVSWYTTPQSVPQPVETPWVRDRQMTCYQVWVNEDNKFELVFWWPYKDNNWVRIYDMNGEMVYEINMPLDNPHIIVDLPNGVYTVKTFHDQPEPLQEFVIGK